MLCSILINCYKDNSHEVVFEIPVTRWLIKYLGTIFAEDTDLCTFNLNLHTREEVFAEM